MAYSGVILQEVLERRMKSFVILVLPYFCFCDTTTGNDPLLPQLYGTMEIFSQ